MTQMCKCCGRFPLAKMIASGLTKIDPDKLLLAIKAATPKTHTLPPKSTAPAYLFTGGTILTMDHTQPTAEALLIQGNKITYVGPQSKLPPLPSGTETINLNGQCLMPGFVDAHMHLVGSAMDVFMTDLSPSGLAAKQLSYTMANVLSVLQLAIDSVANPKSDWVFGAGFDASQLNQWENLTVFKLDCLTNTSNIPIIVQAGSGHISFANSATLALAGISTNTPNPEGGYIGRYGAGNSDNQPVGSLSGIFVEFPAQSLLKDALLKRPFIPDPFKLTSALSALMSTATSLGITLLNDAGIGLTMEYGAERLLINVVRSATKAAPRLSSAMFLDEWDGATPPAAYSNGPNFDNPMFVTQAVKLFADGSNQGVTGYQTKPYSDWAIANTEADYLGSHTTGNADATVSALSGLMQKSIGYGWQIMVHANGDAAIDNTISAYQDAGVNGHSDLRHRIEHCSILRPDQIATMAKLGLSPSFLIAHVTTWGAALQKILGDDRANLLDPAQSALKGGLRVSLHTDHPVSPLGSLQLAQDAATRIMAGVSPPNIVLNPAECLSVDQAMIAITADAAWQCRMDNFVGSLKVGQLADLVILAQTPNQAGAAALGQIKVVQTWVDGNQVYPVAN